MRLPVIYLLLCWLVPAGFCAGIASAQGGQQDADLLPGPVHERKFGPGNNGQAGRRPAGEFRRSGGFGEGARMEAFKKADEDGDGNLSFSEFSSMQRLQNLDEAKRRKLFDYLDRDQDGSLQIPELLPREPRWLGMVRREFDRLDQNGDEALDISEFSGLSKLVHKNGEKLPKLFEKIDHNKNGKIERAELKPMGHHMKRPQINFSIHDANASGGLDYSEYEKIPWMQKWPDERRKKLFDRIDTDGDGEISKEEIDLAHEKARPGRHGKQPMRPRAFPPHKGPHPGQ